MGYVCRWPIQLHGNLSCLTNFFTIVYPVEVDLSDKACISRRGAIVSASLIAASTAMLAAGRAYGEEFAEATLLSPNDAISFLYIDNAQLEAGAEQNVVVSLSQHTRVSAAVLTVQDEAGAEQACTLSSVQDNALLFTFFPSGMGSCEVARLQFKADGAAYEIDLSEVMSRIAAIKLRLWRLPIRMARRQAAPTCTCIPVMVAMSWQSRPLSRRRHRLQLRQRVARVRQTPKRPVRW